MAGRPGKVPEGSRRIGSRAEVALEKGRGEVRGSKSVFAVSKVKDSVGSTWSLQVRGGWKRLKLLSKMVSVLSEN